MDVNKALATHARRTAGAAAYRAGYGNAELVAGCAAGREQQVIRRAMAGDQEWYEAFTYVQVGNRHILGHAVCAVGPGRTRGGRRGCADNE